MSKRALSVTREQNFPEWYQAIVRDGDMADMDFDDYRAMVEESPVETAIIEFRDDSADGRLVGACLVDWLSSGVSAVYSFFDPQHPRDDLAVLALTQDVPPGVPIYPLHRGDIESGKVEKFQARWISDDSFQIGRIICAAR